MGTAAFVPVELAHPPNASKDQSGGSGGEQIGLAHRILLPCGPPLENQRQFINFCWEARRDEPGREGAHTQQCPYLGTIAAHLNLIARLMLSDDSASHALG